VQREHVNPLAGLAPADRQLGRHGFEVQVGPAHSHHVPAAQSGKEGEQVPERSRLRAFDLPGSLAGGGHETLGLLRRQHAPNSSPIDHLVAALDHFWDATAPELDKILVHDPDADPDTVGAPFRRDFVQLFEQFANRAVDHIYPTSTDDAAG